MRLLAMVPQAVACWPATGRHLCFDGRKLHGAMADLTPPPAHSSGASSGRAGGGSGGSSGRPAGGDAPIRITFLVNVWFNHVPWGAEPLPPKVAKRLRASLPSGALQLGAQPGTATAGGGGCVGGAAGGKTSGGGGKKSGGGKCGVVTGAAVPRVPTAVGSTAADWADATPYVWTFGDAPSKYTLALPWPTARIRQLWPAEAPEDAPVVEVDIAAAPEAAGSAELRPARKGAGASAAAKKKKKPSAKKRKR